MSHLHYVLVNGTDSVMSDVNAANEDVPARSMRHVEMSQNELKSFIDRAGAAVMEGESSRHYLRAVGRILIYREKDIHTS
jgi:hypothetical protein